MWVWSLFVGRNQPCSIYNVVPFSSCQFLLFLSQSREEKVCPLASFLYTPEDANGNSPGLYHFTRMASRERRQVKELWFLFAFPARFTLREPCLIPWLEVLNTISLNYISFLILFYGNFGGLLLFISFYFFFSFHQDLGKEILWSLSSLSYLCSYV